MKTNEPKIVRSWWKVRHNSNEYEFGPDHETDQAAKFYLEKCVDKARRPNCHIVKYTLTREPAE